MAQRQADSLALSEKLMRLGWWHEAELALENDDVSPSDRLLQGSALLCRRECVEWLMAHNDMPEDTMRLHMLKQFDIYTVGWVLREYSGEGALKWRTESGRVNDLTD